MGWHCSITSGSRSFLSPLAVENTPALFGVRPGSSDLLQSIISTARQRERNKSSRLNCVGHELAHWDKYGLVSLGMRQCEETTRVTFSLQHT